MLKPKVGDIIAAELSPELTFFIPLTIAVLRSKSRAGLVLGKRGKCSTTELHLQQQKFKSDWLLL